MSEPARFASLKEAFSKFELVSRALSKLERAKYAPCASQASKFAFINCAPSNFVLFSFEFLKSASGNLHEHKFALSNLQF